MTCFLAFIGGLGWPELLVIGAVVLLVFGPKRLPEIAEAFGKSINRFKSATREAKEEVRREIELPEDESKESTKTPPSD